MEKAFAKAEELAFNLKEYLHTKIESVKLSMAEKTSVVIANIIAKIVVALVFVFFLVFASIALSLVLGAWVGKTWAGFLIVAGFYLVTGIIIWLAREQIIRLPVMNALLKQMSKNDEED